jgi:hypothetical protein
MKLWCDVGFRSSNARRLRRETLLQRWLPNLRIGMMRSVLAQLNEVIAFLIGFWENKAITTYTVKSLNI